ncbi:MAG TPA: DUF4159 domain-containing protein [Candidatus Latescibacteria bacterium]|nr:DUF4159 domain-containing protein [Candidatus Latescibacterota bacterium]
MLASVFLHTAAFVISYVYLPKVGRKEEARRVRFVPRPPILKKSFDLAKRPEISEVQMEMLARLDQPQPVADLTRLVDISSLGADLLGAVTAGIQFYAPPSGAKAASIEFKPVELVTPTRMTAAQEAVSIRTELLGMKNLDTGRYNAVIITNPADKKAITGYFNMTLVEFNYQDPKVDTFPLAIPNLLRYMNDHTKIKASIKGQKIELSSPELFKAPFIYMTGQECVVSLSPVEIENLGNYLRSGGFLFVEDIAHSREEGAPPDGGGIAGTTFDQQMRAVLKQALGRDAKFFRIPKNHPLFHSFYDFDDGPPLGGASGGNVNYLEGIEIRGRLAVVFSDLNISWYWGDPNAAGRERGLQFGVNLIVYALTQPGGIANIGQYTW